MKIACGVFVLSNCRAEINHLSDAELKIEPVRVITLHGIRTRGEWQKELGDRLSENGCTTSSLDYGFFTAVQFLWPPSRRKKVQWLLTEYTQITRAGRKMPCIVAHSHGTWLVAELLRTRSEVKFDRIILCGSIVPRNFPWSECKKRGQFSRVLNDYAGRDWVVRLAEYAAGTAGTSGRYGFTDEAAGDVLQRRNPEFSHSDVFNELNYRNNWIPFLKGGNPQNLDAIDPPPINWKYIAALAVLFAVLVSLAIYLYSLFPTRSDLSVPLTDSQYPSVESVDFPSKSKVDAAAPSPNEKFSVIIENETASPIQVVVFNCYKKYYERDFSQPGWAQLAVISPGDSKPANVKNVKSRLFAFFVRNSTSAFEYLGAFDLREIPTLVIAESEDGQFEVGAQPVEVGER